MGRYSSKKRKGTRKQSFKNRKRVKKGGDNHSEEAAAPTETVDNTNQDAAAPTDTVDNTNQDAAAPTDTVDNTNQDAAAPTTTDNTDQNVATTETVDNTGDAQTGDAQTGQTDTNANEAGNENAGPDWKEGQSEEEIKQAEDKVKEIEDMEPEEIDKLAKELAEMPGTPLWAKALAKSGAAGTAAKFLNAHPDLKKALIDKGIEGIKNADVSMAPGSASAPGAQSTGTGAPGANTSAAAPGGSYTADDAGYQKFVEAVKTNPGILNEVVYVNDQMSQIFIKKNGNWQQLE
jgi:hypothetical protein